MRATVKRKPSEHGRSGQAWGRGEVPAHIAQVLASRKPHTNGGVLPAVDNSPWAQRWRYLIAAGWL